MVNNINMDNLCEGCLIYEEYKKDPINHIQCIGYIVQDIGCPCMHCLLKMMCVTTCKEIEERKWPVAYHRRYNRNIRNYKND